MTGPLHKHPSALTPQRVAELYDLPAELLFGQPFTCARCGGLVHSEVVNVYDVDGNEEIGHAFYCQAERRADGQPASVREIQS